MLVEGISRRQLQAAAIETLRAADTLAADRVFEPRDWPTKPDLFPVLLVQAPRDRKKGLLPGQLQFDTTITLVVVGRVWGTDPDAINESLDVLAAQIENALMLTEGFALAIQQFVTIETQSVVSAEAKQQIGELGMTFELEVYQAFGPEGVPLTNVTGTLTPAAGAQSIIFQSESTAG